MPGKGIDPAIFGPMVWDWLHTISNRWDRSDADNPKIYARAVGGLVHMLPCRTCRESFCEFFRQLRPLVLSTDGMTEEWAYDLHAHVNKKLGKHNPPLSLVRKHAATPRQIDPVWPMLEIFLSHYDATGVSNKSRVYRRYVQSLAELYRELGREDTAHRLETLAENMRGRMSSQHLISLTLRTMSK